MPDPDQQPRGPDRQWSPFPVQNWETMPSAGPWELQVQRVLGVQRVPPAEPRRVPAPWVPALVMVVVGCLVASALYVGDRVGRPATYEITAFLPADGAHWFGERRTHTDTRDTTATTVTESAIIDGPAISGAVDFQLGGAILAETGTDAAVRNRFWRLTTTTLGPSAGRDTQVYRGSADLVRLGESGPGFSYLYSPGLIELPRGVAPDASWESHGDAGSGFGYHARFHATAAEQDCLRVAGTINYQAGAHEVARTQAKTWCPHQGIVAASDGSPDTDVSWSPTGPPAMNDPTTIDPPHDSTPTGWRPHELLNTSVDPLTGRSPMVGSPGAFAPVFTASGVLVRTNLSGQDVSGFTAADATDWVLSWRGHPGGSVLTVTAFGNVIVATTSDRRVVGYSDRGVRLWELDLDEVVMKAPVRASENEMALVSLAGRVLVVELSTRHIRWQATPGTDVGVGPVVSAGVLTVADRGGDLIGLDVATGVQRWRSVISTARLQAAVGSVLTVVSDGDVFGIDSRTGRRLWRASYLGVERGVVAFGDWVVVTHVGGSTAFDAAGRQIWDEPEVHAVTPAGQFLVRWGRARADVLDGRGVVVTSFDTPQDTAGNTSRFAAGPDGVYLMDGTWRFTGWTRG